MNNSITPGVCIYPGFNINSLYNPENYIVNPVFSFITVKKQHTIQVDLIVYIRFHRRNICSK